MNKYKFIEKEMDNEIRYDYFGVSYYNNKLGVCVFRECLGTRRGLSADPLAHKYQHWSPYNYAANNPLRFLDPHGDTLDIGGNTNKALENIKSMVDHEIAKRLTMDGNRISFNVDGLDVSSDTALKLLSNLVNSKVKYLYEVLGEKDDIVGTLRTDGSAINTTFSNYFGVANFSSTSYNTNGGIGGPGLAPKNGYAGQVAMGTISYVSLDGSPQPTSNITFHELSENWYRTNNREPRMNKDNIRAHQDAINDADNYKKQVGPSGGGCYVPPKN